MNQTTERYDTVKTVLVVDDCQEILEMLIRAFRGWGFTVRPASNGAEAVEIAKSGSPDLIFMDLQMPVMSGYDATCRIRSNASTRHIPIIIFSSDCEGEMCEALRVAGCNECLQKPVDLAAIHDVVQRYLGPASEHRF